MKREKKVIALLLALLLFLSLLPVGALAAGDADPAEEEEVPEAFLTPEDACIPDEEALSPENEEKETPPRDNEELLQPPEECEEALSEAEDCDTEVTVMSGAEEEEAGEEGEGEGEPLRNTPSEDLETGLLYTVEDGEATITGFSAEITPADLVIPATLGGCPVTAIGEYAFRYNYKLTSISIPDSVTEIGNDAFFHCEALTGFTFPEGVTEINSQVLCYCRALTSITLPDSATIIKDYAFEGCSAVTAINIPKKLKTIHTMAFYKCEKLTAFTVDAENPYYSAGNGALLSRDGSTLVMCPIGRRGDFAVPSGVKTIGRGAFEHCERLTGIEIPDSVTAIEDEAFSNCTALERVEIGNGVTSLGHWSFYNCEALQAVVLPNSLKTIDEAAFQYCSALKTITLPNSLTAIKAETFENCSSLESIEIPDSVTDIGERAFRFCESLSSVSLPSRITTIEKSVFNGCKSLAGIVIPNTVTDIGEYAFANCKALPAIAIPEGVTAIGGRAFLGCESLTGFVIPEGVTAIREYTFYGCAALRRITVPSSVTAVGQGAFSFCSSLAEIAIPDTVTEIGENAFRSCELLSGISLPGSIGVIGNYTFFGCKALTGVVIPNGVTEIGERSFQECSSLKTLTIPNSVAVIGASAFSGCPLRTVYYTGTEEQRGEIEIGEQNYPLIDAAWVFNAGDTEPIAIALEKDYIALKAGKSAELTLTAPENLPVGVGVVWTVNDSGIAELAFCDNSRATVMGKAKGTVWVTATLCTTQGHLSARCRVDVTANEVLQEVESVTLRDSKVAVEVFRTDYTRITVVPNLRQNAFGTAGLIGGIPDPEMEYEGDCAIKKAEFADTGAAKYFHLRVVDDRTLEIVPTEAALIAANTQDRALKGSYKSAVRVWIGGVKESNPLTTAPMTLTVKKSLPAVKAKAVKINSFIFDEQQVEFTGGTVTKITVPELPGWLKQADGDEPGRLTLRYSGSILYAAPKSQKTTLQLTVEVDGWAVDRVVPVAVTAAPVRPKVKFSGKAVTINPTFDLREGYASAAAVSVSISPADYLLRDEVMNTVDSSFFEENGQPCGTEDGVLGFEGQVYQDSKGQGKLMLLFGIGPGFGSTERARTFRFCLNIAGKTYPLTIRTLPVDRAALGLGVKAKGAIDTAVPNSPVTLELTLKNTSQVHPDLYRLDSPCGQYTVEILRGTEPVKTFTLCGDPATEAPDKFSLVSSSLTLVTLTQADLGPFDAGAAYKARVTVKYGSGDAASATAELKIPVKNSDPKKVPLTVTAKVKGKLDALSPDSAVLLTPNVKNGFGIDLSDPGQVQLAFLRKEGSRYDDAADIFTAEANEEGTGFLIRLSPGSSVDVGKDRFFVSVRVTDPSDPTREASLKTPAALPLTSGKVKITQSAKTLILLKKDRNSSAAFTLGTENPALRITEVRITNDKKGLYRLAEGDYGRYVLSCTDRMTANSLKNTTLKLKVTVTGSHGSTTATVSMKVSWK